MGCTWQYTLYSVLLYSVDLRCMAILIVDTAPSFFDWWKCVFEQEIRKLHLHLGYETLRPLVWNSLLI